MRRALVIYMSLAIVWPTGVHAADLPARVFAYEHDASAEAEPNQQQPANHAPDYSDPLLQRPSARAKHSGRQPSNKGIHVGQPKIFDDRSLQLMLSAAEQRLATLQILDQARTTANIGAIQGGSQSESGFAAQIAAAPTPSIVTTTGSNNSLATGTSQSLSGGTTGANGITVVTGTGPATTTVSSTGTTSGSNASSNASNTSGTTASTQTSMPSINPTILPAPAPSGLSLPTNVSVSASDVLSEEMQLTYEIANLRLLLQGSLNDRFVTGNQRLKQHATIGFPISIEPPNDSRYKNAVAEVTATVTTWPDFFDQDQNEKTYAKAASVYKNQQQTGAEPVCRAYAGPDAPTAVALYSDRACPDAPGLMAILPREKTYNVVDIKANSVNLSGAATAKVLTAGVTWYHATKHFYVVQAQDTVAFEDNPHLQQNDGRLNQVSSTFGWQFRPVLNETRVRPGLRQLFAELSFPTLPYSKGGKFYGTVTVEARWRQYDPKSGSVGDYIRDSRYEKQELSFLQPGTAASTAQIPSIEWIGAWQLSNFDLQPKLPEDVNWEEAGVGVISVSANGFYTPGTAVVVGANVYNSATSNYFYDPLKIRFVAPAADLLRTGKIFLEEQGGQQRPLDRDENKLGAFDRILILEAKAMPYSSTEMVLSVCYTGGLQTDPKDNVTRPLALVGSTVFGLSDQPYIVLAQNPCKDTNNSVISLRAPTDLVRNAKQVKIKQLFGGPKASAEHSIEIVNEFSAAKLVPIAAANKCTLFAIQGSKLFFEPLGGNITEPPLHVRIGDQEISILSASTKDHCSFVPLPEKSPTQAAPKPMPASGNTDTGYGHPASNPAVTDHKDKNKPAGVATAPKEPPCKPETAYVDTTLGLATLLIAAPDCLLKGVKQIEIYRGDTTIPRGLVQTVLLPISEDKPAAAQIDTIEVQAGTKTIHLKGAHLELVDLNSLYFTGFVGVSLNPKFPADASYIEVTLPDLLTKTTGNYALNFTQQDKDKSPGGALLRIVKPKTQ